LSDGRTPGMVEQDPQIAVTLRAMVGELIGRGEPL
jgi:hypothetical protein